MPSASPTTYTYRVADSRARVVATPMGRLIRHLGLDNHIRGVLEGEWVRRLHGGYVRATLLEQLPTSFGVTSIRGERAWHGPPPMARRTPRTPGVGTYLVIDPDGHRRVVKNLARFCRKHGLSAPHMYYVVGRRKKNYQGWRVRRLDDKVSR